MNIKLKGVIYGDRQEFSTGKEGWQEDEKRVHNEWIDRSGLRKLCQEKKIHAQWTMTTNIPIRTKIGWEMLYEIDPKIRRYYRIACENKTPPYVLMFRKSRQFLLAEQKVRRARAAKEEPEI